VSDEFVGNEMARKALPSAFEQHRGGVGAASRDGLPLPEM
jgi:hypothetical protein